MTGQVVLEMLGDWRFLATITGWVFLHGVHNARLHFQVKRLNSLLSDDKLAQHNQDIASRDAKLSALEDRVDYVQNRVDGMG